MFKKHIAINQNGHPSTDALAKRGEILSTLLLSQTDLMRDPNRKVPTALDNIQEYTSAQKIQQETNKRLNETETILKDIFRFQNIPFIEFSLKNTDAFKRRFAAFKSYNRQTSIYDSDSESPDNSEVSKEDVQKLLRLYLRLYIRKHELNHICSKTQLRIIGYPRTLIPERGQIENSYSHVEAYKNTEKQTLVLSKSSFLVQKKNDEKLFNTNEAIFLDEIIEKVTEVQKSYSLFDPNLYSPEPPVFSNTSGIFIEGRNGRRIDHNDLRNRDPFS